MSGYALHPEAFADLDEIWEYIAQDNVDAADRVLTDIHSTLTTLAGSPQIGHRRPDLTTRPLRFHVARDEYVGRRLFQPDAQEIAQRQRIRCALGNATLRINAFKIADQQQPEIDPRWQLGRPIVSA